MTKGKISFLCRAIKKIRYSISTIIKVSIWRLVSSNRKPLDSVDIAIFFSATPQQLYQLNTWMIPLSTLAKTDQIGIVTTDIYLYDILKKSTSYKIVFCYNTVNLMALYSRLSPKAILYINNAFLNYASLHYDNAQHIFLGHGSGDKVSDHSNQAKAYDIIAVAGENAQHKYKNFLHNIDPATLVPIGRPQLDCVKPIKVNTHNLSVIAYIPTWEGTHHSMRYTSVDIYGEKIVDTILKSHKYFFIYRPHPNLGMRDASLRHAHERILEKVHSHPYAMTFEGDNIIDMYPIINLAIFDISSTITDFLYFNKPFMTTEISNNSHDTHHYNFLEASSRINQHTIDSLLDKIFDELVHDQYKEARKKVKHLYLGQYLPGESLKKFLKLCTNISHSKNYQNFSRQEQIYSTRQATLQGSSEMPCMAIYLPDHIIDNALLAMLDDISTQLPVTFVVRKKNTYKYLSIKSSLSTVLCRTLNDLIAHYTQSNYKFILYPYDNARNFQSLICHRSLHLFLNEATLCFPNTKHHLKAYDFAIDIEDLQKILQRVT